MKKICMRCGRSFDTEELKTFTENLFTVADDICFQCVLDACRKLAEGGLLGEEISSER